MYYVFLLGKKSYDYFYSQAAMRNYIQSLPPGQKFAAFTFDGHEELILCDVGGGD